MEIDLQAILQIFQTESEEQLRDMEVLLVVDVPGLNAVNLEEKWSVAYAIAALLQNRPAEDVDARILFVDGRQVLCAQQLVWIVIQSSS